MRIKIALIIILLMQFSAQAQNIKLGISENTAVEIVAEWPIGEDTQIGEHFSARVLQDLTSSSGEIYLPKDSRVIGRVVDIKEAGNFHKAGKVDIKFERILFPDNITKINIEADGTLIKENHILSKAGQAGLDLVKGGAVGAILGFRFGGIIGSSSTSNIAIGAAAGASLSLISFIAKQGENVEINPGLPMLLKINDMEEQNFKGQTLSKNMDKDDITASIKKINDKKISITIENNLDQSIPLSNLKIIDALGFTIKPIIEFRYHDPKAIGGLSTSKYTFEFTPTTKRTKYWLVLTDSFNKREYFRKEI